MDSIPTEIEKETEVLLQEDRAPWTISMLESLWCSDSEIDSVRVGGINNTIVATELGEVSSYSTEDVLGEASCLSE